MVENLLNLVVFISNFFSCNYVESFLSIVLPRYLLEGTIGNPKK